MEQFTFIIKDNINSVSIYIASLAECKTLIYDSSTQYPDNSNLFNFCIPYGETKFMYDGIEIIAKLIKDDQVVGLNDSATKYEELSIIIFHDSYTNAINLFKKIVIDAKNNYYANSRLIAICPYQNNSWGSTLRIPKRTLDTIYLDPEIKDLLTGDLNNFYQNDYHNKIPIVRKYLLHGPTGTGKTSLIYALTAIHNKHIATTYFNKNTSHHDLIKMLAAIDNKYVLLLENIESIFDDNEHNLTIDCLFNAIDLVCHKTKLVVFATTKNFDKVIKNMMGSNHFDVITKINYPGKEITGQIYQDFFPNQPELFEEIYKKISKKSVTIPFLINLFKNNHTSHQDTKTFFNKIDMLFDLYSNKYGNQLYN